MDFERLVWILTQVMLVAAWVMVISFTGRGYLRLASRTKSEKESGVTTEEARIRRSFLGFAGIFMPSLAALLPVFALLPATDQLFIPSVFTWLVLLVFGTLQYSLNLIPMKAALAIIAGLEDADPRPVAVPFQSASSEHQRRNV